MSQPEELLLSQIRLAGLPEPEPEHRFWPGRRFRFDFAWPALMLACEVEGGTWVSGRHSRGKGYEADCIKYAEAVLRGWKVIRVTSQMVERGDALILLRRAIEGEPLCEP